MPNGDDGSGKKGTKLIGWFDNFTTLYEATKSAVNRAKDLTRKAGSENREYGGWIYKTKNGYKYSVLESAPGKNLYVGRPMDIGAVRAYHSHTLIDEVQGMLSWDDYSNFRQAFYYFGDRGSQDVWMIDQNGHIWSYDPVKNTFYKKFDQPYLIEKRFWGQKLTECRLSAAGGRNAGL